MALFLSVRTKLVKKRWRLKRRGLGLCFWAAFRLSLSLCFIKKINLFYLIGLRFFRWPGCPCVRRSKSSVFRPAFNGGFGR